MKERREADEKEEADNRKEDSRERGGTEGTRRGMTGKERRKKEAKLRLQNPEGE